MLCPRAVLPDRKRAEDRRKDGVRGQELFVFAESRIDSSINPFLTIDELGSLTLFVPSHLNWAWLFHAE